MSQPEQMTRKEAREYLYRVRMAEREARKAIVKGDRAALLEAVLEIGGCAGEIEGQIDDPNAGGIRGVR